MTEQNNNKNKNPIWNAYFAVDNFLVDRANEAVKAWNWTTGRTRAELASTVNILGNTFIGFSNKGLIPVAGISAYLANQVYTGMDIEEEKCIGQNSLSMELEISRNYRKTRGPLQVGLGVSIFPLENKYMDMPLFGAGFFLNGISEYIMRADYQAPRKDCIRRGLEHLTEAMSRQPALETSRAEIYAGGLA